MSYDSDLAPRKESQSTLPGAQSNDEQPNVKVSGGKRKKPAAPRREAKAKLVQRATEKEMSESENGEGLSDEDREIKSRRLMSPTEALLDAAQAKVPAPELRDRRHSRASSASFVAARRQTTFTLKPPRGDSSTESDGRPSIGARAAISAVYAAPGTQDSALVNRYGNARRHRKSPSPGSTSAASQFHSFSAIVATGRSGVTGMDTTVEEAEESMESGETSGGSISKQNTASMSVSALHEESSYEAMEKEVQANRMPEATSGLVSGSGQPMETPRQTPFNPPRATSSQQHQQEHANVSRQPFFPIPAAHSNAHITSSANKRRPARQSTDNEAYRPIGGTSSVNTHQVPRAATDSADEDGGGEGLAAHLPERSTRGKRHEQGEGYLGTGLSFTPNSTGKSRQKKADSGRLDSGEMGEHDGGVPHLDVESTDEAKLKGAASRGRGAKFNTPARSAKSASVGPSPVKEAISGPTSRPEEPAYHIADNKTERKLDSALSPVSPHAVSPLVLWLIPTFSLQIHRFFAGLSQVWVERLKWAGIIAAVLVAMSWLVNHAPEGVTSDISQQGQHSFSSRMPHSTGRVAKDQDETSVEVGFLLERMDALEATLASVSGELHIAKQEEDRVKQENEIARGRIEQLAVDLQEERSKRLEQGRDLDQLHTTLRSFRQQSEVSTSSISSLVEDVNQKVNRVESSVEDALGEQRMAHLLGRILPDSVPVKRDPKTGQVSVDPAFWTEIRKVLATKADLDSLSSKVSIMKKKQDNDIHSTQGSVSSPITKTPSWQEFLDENGEHLSAFADRMFDRKMLDADVIDRPTFVSTLKDELYALKSTLIDEASKREHSAMSAVNKKLDSIRNQHTSETIAEPVITVGNSHTDITPTLQRLIDDSLLKYSKDTLARTDFALASGGAQIIHDQTSKSMDLVREKGAWSWLTGERRLGLVTTGRMPEIVLHPSNQPGMCWPFDGSRGEVGIHLSREVHVTDITVEHAARELVSAKSLASAPKDIELVSTFSLE